jgi:hypothetical protein
VEKGATSLVRTKLRIKNLTALVKQLQSLSGNAKIKKSKWTKLKRLQRAGWSPSGESLDSIRDALVQAGYQVRVTFGEADVSIATTANVLAVSTDSDMFFAPNVLVCAKPFLGSTISFQVMERPKVLKTLEISNSCWAALAVVSGMITSQISAVMESRVITVF